MRIIGRKLGVLVLLSISAVAFATLGDGKVASTSTNKSLLLNKSQAGNFNLRTGYAFRGSKVFGTKETKYISLNPRTTISYQNGHTTYVLPLKKKGLDKVTFNPNEATRR